MSQRIYNNVVDPQNFCEEFCALLLEREQFVFSLEKVENPHIRSELRKVRDATSFSELNSAIVEGCFRNCRDSEEGNGQLEEVKNSVIESEFLFSPITSVVNKFKS